MGKQRDGRDGNRVEWPRYGKEQPAVNSMTIIIGHGHL